jgi:hypothetical protein
MTKKPRIMTVFSVKNAHRSNYRGAVFFTPESYLLDTQQGA